MINKSITYLVIFFFIVTGVVVGISLFSSDQADAKEVTVYKSPDCGCCVGYISELKSEGYKVNSVDTRDMAGVKNKYSIPEEMESCHTMVMGDYAIEGHVPLEVVEGLSTDLPNIDGISLPDMPAGSPGMPGEKQEPFEIFQLNDGQASKYLTV